MRVSRSQSSSVRPRATLAWDSVLPSSGIHGSSIARPARGWELIGERWRDVTEGAAHYFDEARAFHWIRLAGDGPERLIALAGDGVVELRSFLLAQLAEQFVALFGCSGKAVVDDALDDRSPDAGFDEAIDEARPPDRRNLVGQLEPWPEHLEALEALLRARNLRHEAHHGRVDLGEAIVDEEALGHGDESKRDDVGATDGLENV